jgi:hypothetical protein
MGIFEKDPKFQRLQHARPGGYLGAVDENGRRVKDLDKWIRKTKAAGRKQPRRSR